MDDSRQQAETNLQDQLAALRLADPRDAYRQRLRTLREAHPDAFARAVQYYEEVALPRLAEGQEVVETWIEYGRRLGELTSPGRVVAVEPGGRATTYREPFQPDWLVLHIPEDRAAAVLALAVPAELSAAQRATHDLLVQGRLSL